MWYQIDMKVLISKLAQNSQKESSNIMLRIKWYITLYIGKNHWQSQWVCDNGSKNSIYGHEPHFKQYKKI